MRNLRPWTHPKTSVVRLYINDHFFAQDLKIWLEKGPAGEAVVQYSKTAAFHRPGFTRDCQYHGLGHPMDAAQWVVSGVDLSDFNALMEQS